MKKQKAKKKKSIFWTTTLVILPLAILADVFILLGAYNYVRETTYDEYKEDILDAVEVTNVLLGDCDLKNPKDAYTDSVELGKLCDLLGLPYIYVLEVDEKAETIKYLTIGAGTNPPYEISETREIGKVNPTENIDFYHSVLNDTSNKHFRHVDSKYADTLISYLPRTGGNVKDEIIAAEVSVSAVMKQLNRAFGITALMVIFFTAVMLVIFAIIIHKRVQNPAKIISQKMSSFVHDRKKGYEKLEVKGSKEFTDMADSFNIMTGEIDRYISDIEALNLEKHTREAELNIARNIQMGLLRPTHTDTDSADIRAYMLPAKDVGGDLYEYRVLGDGRIFAAIADVSGKGISAALFMAHSVTLLSQYAQMGHTPAQILTAFNDTLVTQNPGGLFITTFIAIWDPESGRLTYSNAGHNFPYVLSDALVRLEEAHGVAAGLFEGEQYEDAFIDLKGGDILFLYTDGVNEAKNTDGKFYSTERLEEKLTAGIDSGSSETLNDILSDLNGFTEGAEQNDDITMLTLRVKPQRTETVLRLSSEIPQLVVIKEAIEKTDLSDRLKNKLILAAEEMFVNICSYAYDTVGEVEVRIATDKSMAELTFIDGGKPFDPTVGLPDIDDYDYENTIGGLGRFLTFTMSDGYSYEYRDEKNILTIIYKRGD